MNSTSEPATTRLTKDSADPTGATPEAPLLGDTTGPTPSTGMGDVSGPSPSPGPGYDAPGVPSYLAPVPEPAPRPKFRLRRSRTDRMLGGVCGGVAESLGVDAALVRIGLVTLTVLGVGSGVILYAAMWLLVPETDEP